MASSRAAEDGGPRFDGLRALFINCTLKRSPERSHTDGLIELSSGIMRRRGVEVDVLRAVDHDIATGVWPDMTEHGWAVDEWPAIYERVLAADILVLCGPIWLGDNSSVMKRVIERLYALLVAAQRAGPVRLLRPGRRVSDHRQRGWRQALRDECPLQPPAPGLHDPAAGRRGLDRADRPRPLLPRPRLGRPRERLHQPQHDVYDVQPHARGGDAQAQRRHASVRESAERVGRGVQASTPRIRSTDEQRPRRSSPTTCSTGWHARRWSTRWAESTTTARTSSAWSAPRRAGCSGLPSRSRILPYRDDLPHTNAGFGALFHEAFGDIAGRKGAGAVERGLPRRVARRRNEALPARAMRRSAGC